MIAYKLFKTRKDGSIGPLFINASARLPIGEWMKAECHPTKGFAVRAGWHSTPKPYAPHLKRKLKSGEVRDWYLVEITNIRAHERPKAQGGVWFTSQRLKIITKIDI